MPVAKLIKFRKGFMTTCTKIRGIRLLLLSGVVAGTTCMPQSVLSQPQPLIKKEWIVVIDAGHGGKDPGSIGYTKSKEKDITLSVALRTGKYIKENLKDVRVIYTRDEDKFIGLDERAEVANRNKADIFISIHTNAVDDKRAAGAESWVLGQSMDDANLKVAMKENSVIVFEKDYQTKYEGYDPNSVESFIIFSLMQNTFLKQSTDFASTIQNQLRDRVGRRDRGVKQAGFMVLWCTTMPSVLVELGFISHPEEERFLLSESGQDYLASAIFRAFRDYKQSIDTRSGLSTEITGTKEKQEATETVVQAGKETDVTTAAVETNDKNASLTESPGSTVKERKAEEEIWFMVQVAALPKNKAPKNTSFRGIDAITRLDAGDRYKFGAGKFSSYNDAVKYRRSLSDKYPDAFVIAVRNGRVIPLNEALKSNR